MIPGLQAQKWLVFHHQVELSALNILVEMFDSSDKSQGLFV